MPVKEMLAGCLLGDAYCGKLGHKESLKARVRFNHGGPQKNYVLYKYGLLQPICRQEPREVVCKGYGETSWVFTTRSLDWLNEMYALCWSEGKRIVAEKTRQYFSPEALAFWYMDDGSWHGRGTGLNIHSNGFSRDENAMLRDWLKDIYNIEASEAFDSRHDQYYIRMRKAPAWEFARIVAPYICPSLRYKLPPQISTEAPFSPPDWAIPVELQGLCVFCKTRPARQIVCTAPECQEAKRKRDNARWTDLNNDRLKDQRREAHEARLPEQPCEVCGKPFSPKSVCHRTCSAECHREKERQYALARSYAVSGRVEGEQFTLFGQKALARQIKQPQKKPPAPRSPRVPPPAKESLAVQYDAQIREWAKKGVCEAEICRRTNLTRSIISKYCKKNGIECAKSVPFFKEGASNPKFNGGTRPVFVNGALSIYKPDHPFCNKRGYVPEHRLVMEEAIGRLLKPSECVLRKDGNHSNNALSNLELFESRAAALREIQRRAKTR